MIIDTHCHIHESEFFPDAENREEIYNRAISANVYMICVATSYTASKEALEFSKHHKDTSAIIGVHPHDAKSDIQGIGDLLQENKTSHNLVGIGEIGLDYYYMNSPRHLQIAALEQQLQWAIDYNLPVSFHVRDSERNEQLSVWDDFWPIFDNFPKTRGVLHSFTDNQDQLESGLERDLFFGVNGIATFTKDVSQIKMFESIPLKKILLETDTPFLTPAPLRGKMNEPSFVGRVADHMATLKNVSISEVIATTTDNAKHLFNI